MSRHAITQAFLLCLLHNKPFFPIRINRLFLTKKRDAHFTASCAKNPNRLVRLKGRVISENRI